MVGLVDCDSFFCSCERVFRPDLERKPVVVLSNNDGCVVARSKEVKAIGVPEGMPYFKMMEEYGDRGIVAFSSNYTLYADMSGRVMRMLSEMAPGVMQYSIDEAFLNLEGMDECTLKQWGEEVCRKVTQGTGIPVSLGIAPSKTLSKMASKYAKRYPGYHKCCMIGTEEQREKALRMFPVGDVWGIGRRTARKLEYYGVNTAWEFAQRNRSWVRGKFHVTGERTWEELNGKSVIEIDGMDGVTKKTIVTSRSFPDMITELSDLKAHVANYAARCAAKLRRQGSVCEVLSVFVQSNYFRTDLPQYSNEGYCTFMTPTNTTPELVAAAMGVLEGVFRKGISFKRAGVMVSGLSTSSVIQTDLFTYDEAQSEKYRRVSETLDMVNRRFGADTVVLGSQQYREFGPDGKGIRFVNAIRRAKKSPDYTTRLGDFTV